MDSGIKIENKYKNIEYYGIDISEEVITNLKVRHCYWHLATADFMKKESIKSVLDSNQNGKYYDDGFKNISITKLSHNDYTFNYPEYYHYKIKGKKLYLNYFNSNNDILIVNHKVDKIISFNDKTLLPYKKKCAIKNPTCG